MAFCAGEIEETRIADVIRINREQRVSLNVAKIIDCKHHPRTDLMLKTNIHL